MQPSKFPHTPVSNPSISNSSIIFTAVACLLVLILVIATVMLVSFLVKAPPAPATEVVESVQDQGETLLERTHFQEGYSMVLPTGFTQQSRDVSENGQIVYRFGSEDGCKFTFAIIPDESIDRFTIPPNDFSQTLVKGVRELEQDIDGEVDPVRVWADGMTASLFRFYEKETFRGVNFTYCMVAMDRGRKLVLKIAGKYGRYSEREETIEMPEHWYDALVTLSRDRHQEEPNAKGKQMTMTNHPASITELESVFGKASEAGFGSAVFFNPKIDANGGSLETESKAIYQKFCGDTWRRYGAEKWLATWASVYERPSGIAGDIVNEIGSISDFEARSAAILLFDAGDDSSRAKLALSEAFDDPRIRQLQIFKIGDGAAMSGVLIAAETKSAARQFLIILMD